MTSPRPSARGADPSVIAGVAARLDELHDHLSVDEQQALAHLLARAEGSMDVRRLAQLEPADLLDSEEQAVVAELEAQPDPPPRLAASTVLIMKATRLCNLRCSYCTSWAVGPDQQMDFTTLARVTHAVMRDPGVRSARFVWHGGEPTLRKIDFYLKALWLQLRWRRNGQQLANGMQTNAVGLTDEFIEFCRRFKIGLGVSLDGPPEVHDTRRVDAAGRPTAQRARKGLERIRSAGVEVGVLMVVDTDIAALGPTRLLEYLLELDVDRVGLLNVLPELGAARAGHEVPWLRWDDWLRFLRDLFAAWWPEHAERVEFRELHALVRALRGEDPKLCHYGEDCFASVFTIDPDGAVSACDKYIADPDTEYGSIHDAPAAEVLTNAAVQARRRADHAESAALESCRWNDVCSGGCPFDRAVNEAMGFPTADGCCGLGPLLDDMAATLGVGPPQEASSVDRHHPPEGGSPGPGRSADGADPQAAVWTPVQLRSGSARVLG